MEKRLIKLRIDVDYPYPSRFRSFMYTALGIKTSGDYLKNSKIVAEMINESPEEVKAYWFFTPKTIPDKEMLNLMNNERHEAALHVVNDPYGELKNLEQATGKKLSYYTIHGTARLLARIMWKRWKAKAPEIPADFPLKSFHQYPTEGIDSLCYLHSAAQALKIAQSRLEEGCALYFHPIWLFQRGKMNHRGAFYEPLKRILNVDSDLDTLNVSKKLFFKIARDFREYQRDILPTERFVEKLSERGVDVFTFIERSWSRRIPDRRQSWAKTNDNIALLRVPEYDQWLKNIGKKTRNMIRKAEKSGIKVEPAELNEMLAEGIWRIYNETPIRQGRGFSHYGARLEDVRTMVFSAPDCSYIGAYFQDELIGFVQLVQGDNITLISQILSLQKHFDKAVNNALVAKAVEVCASKSVKYLMYGRMGNHPTLDNFKQNNGFTQFQLTRYYVPLTGKGRIAVKLGLHRELKDALPRAVKYPLFPLYNWISRTRMKIGLKLKTGTMS
jgi:hypothetical protein